MTKNNLHQSLGWLLQQPASTGHRNPDWVVPLTPEDEHQVNTGCDSLISNEEMARLHLAPQTTTKSRLLTQNSFKPALPSPATTHSVLNTSPILHSTIQSTSRALAPTRAAAPQTPMTDYDDEVFDVDDLEDVPLFPDENITTSSFGEFGAPLSLWNESAATRVDPLTKRGKKRKSEEYAEDLVPPRSIRQDTPSSYETAKGGGNSDFRSSSPHAKETRTLDTPHRALKRSSSQVVSPIKLTTMADLEGGLPTSQRTTVPDKKPRRMKRVVVSDSDEDSDAIPEPLLTAKADCEDSTNLDDPDLMEAVQTSSRDGPTFTEESFIQHRVASPDQVSLEDRGKERSSSWQMPSSVASVIAKNENSDSVFPPKLQTTVSTTQPVQQGRVLEEREQSVLRAFITAPDRQYEALLSRQQTLLKDTRKAIAKRMCETEEPDVALESTKQDALAKIDAIKEVIRVRSELKQKSDVHDLKEQKLEELADMDDPPEDDMKTLAAEIRGMRREINNMESSLYSLIEQTGLNVDELHDNKWSSSSAGTPRSQAYPLPQGVLVASTQHPARRPLMSPMPAISRESTSFVQTPSQRMQHTIEATQVMHRSAYPMPSSMPAPLARADSQKHLHPNPTEDYYVRDLGKSVDFTRTMGSPASEHSMIDAFEEEFEDDVDMLEVVTKYDKSFSNNHNHQDSLSQRSVLSQMSHNIRREEFRHEKKAAVLPSRQSYTWTKDVMQALRKRFHLHDFRHNQLEAINATLSGKDAFVLMPTGGGKSLCYQLPSIIQSGKTRGVTVVISPLLSLMQDQVDHLQKLKIQAFMINGEVSAEHRKFVFTALRGPTAEKLIQLLYVTPEMLAKSQAMINVMEDLHGRGKLARIVIDEAHCVSQWGHDFRPDYKTLGEVRRKFLGIPVMALTATATETVKKDTIHNLSIDGCETFTQSFNRPNLTYEVRTKGKGAAVLEEIASIIKDNHPRQSGIIYCLSRKNCEKVAEQLRQQHNIKSAHYHAGMAAEDRSAVQKDWQKGKHHVIVATIAFGMGIDKPDVRYVVHHTIPKSLEGYYQETGRAGRDGQPSKCYLFYGYGDTTQIKRMINEGEGNWQQKDRQKEMLRNVVQFCENKSDCRRSQVLNYFGERFDRADCDNGCDNCQSDSVFESKDFSQHARRVIRLVRQVCGDKVTLLYCVDVYRGAGNKKKVQDAGHDQLSEFGQGADLERGDAERLFYRLVSEDALEEYQEVNRMGFASQYIKLGRMCDGYESGAKKLEFQVRMSSGKKPRGKRKAKAGNVDGDDVGEMPASTMLSSPIAGCRAQLTKRRAPRQQMIATDGEESDDGFEPVREAGVPLKRQVHEQGPPITSSTTQERIARLDEAHRNLIPEFVEQCSADLRKVAIDKSLRQTLVSKTVLEEIAIRFPLTENELREVPGMTKEKVKDYGHILLHRLHQFHREYQQIRDAMLASQHIDDNEVIDLLSDDDDDFIDDQALSDEDDAYDDRSSRYFSARDADEDVAAFNDQASQMRTFTKKRSVSAKPTPRKSSGSSYARYGRGGSGRKSTATRTRGSGNKDVVKRKSSTGSKAFGSGVRATSSTSGKRATSTKTTKSKPAADGGNAFGSIGMMPT